MQIYRYVGHDSIYATNEVQEIVNTLSADARRLLGGIPDTPYLLEEDEDDVVARFLLCVDDIPVAFADLYRATPPYVSITIAVKNDCQRCGYARTLAEYILDWLCSPEARANDIEHINWFARRENTASISLARSLGFCEKSDYADDTKWFGAEF